jgi:hypothetical protein
VTALPGFCLKEKIAIVDPFQVPSLSSAPLVEPTFHLNFDTINHQCSTF